MVEVVWRARAVRHLSAIFDYLHERSPTSAGRYASDIRAACQALAAFPEQGRRYDNRHRMLVVRNHVIFYRYDRRAARVQIAAIFDGRRDLEALMPSMRGTEQ